LEEETLKEILERYMSVKERDKRSKKRSKISVLTAIKKLECWDFNASTV